MYVKISIHVISCLYESSYTDYKLLPKGATRMNNILMPTA